MQPTARAAAYAHTPEHVPEFFPPHASLSFLVLVLTGIRYGIGSARTCSNLIKPEIAAQRWRPAIEHKNSF